MRVVAPGCLEGDVELLFELQLACFYKLAAEGRTAEAIRLSRSHLTPLTQDQPHLVPQVKVAPLTALSYGATLQTHSLAAIVGWWFWHFPAQQVLILHAACKGLRQCLTAERLMRPCHMALCCLLYGSK